MGINRPVNVRKYISVRHHRNEGNPPQHAIINKSFPFWAAGVGNRPYSSVYMTVVDRHPRCGVSVPLLLMTDTQPILGVGR